MNDWKIVDKDTGDTWYKDSRAEAQEAVEEFGDVKNLEIEGPEGEERANITEDNEVVQQGGKTDGGKVGETRQVEHIEEPEPAENFEDELPEYPPIDQDPVNWLPGHFIDEIQGVPTVNRKGYCVIAARYGVSVTAEPVTLPSETEFEYAEFRAVATTEDGQTYSGFGSAHVDRQDGDDPDLLAELAETRAMKRATAWATGIGMTAMSEMTNQL